MNINIEKLAEKTNVLAILFKMLAIMPIEKIAISAIIMCVILELINAILKSSIEKSSFTRGSSRWMKESCLLKINAFAAQYIKHHLTLDKTHSFAAFMLLNGF